MTERRRPRRRRRATASKIAVTGAALSGTFAMVAVMGHDAALAPLPTSAPAAPVAAAPVAAAGSLTSSSHLGTTYGERLATMSVDAPAAPVEAPAAPPSQAPVDWSAQAAPQQVAPRPAPVSRPSARTTPAPVHTRSRAS